MAESSTKGPALEDPATPEGQRVDQTNLNWVKLNTDGVVKPSPGLAGAGSAKRRKGYMAGRIYA